MSEQSLSILQNGSDIRGVATDGIIGERVTLTEEKVGLLGAGFMTWLNEQPIGAVAKQGSRRLRVAIGMDSRLTGPQFMEVLQKTFCQMGADVLNCGLATTPAMLQSTLMDEIGADGAVMITVSGSNLSFNCNGLKFFCHGNEVSKEQLTAIVQQANQTQKIKEAEQKGNVHICNLLATYSRHLREKICEDLQPIAANAARPLEGLKIIVDAGNGAGGFFVNRVLQPLGADTTGSQFLTPDGRFPNHTPDPEDYEAIRATVGAVEYAKADLGIIFDSDVDRAAIVDGKGRVINRNEFVAMAAAIVVEEHPDTSIVTDSITSTGLSTFVQQILGVHQCRYQRGYRNVIGEAIRKNNAGNPCWLAVETSGHAAFKENNFCDDAAYLATKVVIKMAQLKHEGKELYSLIERLPVALESKEYRLQILDSDFSRTAQQTLDGLRQYVSQVVGWDEVNQNHEGVRVMCNGTDESGWFLMRLSLHSPMLAINIEADVKGGIDTIVKKLKLFFRNYRSIDSTVLYN